MLIDGVKLKVLKELTLHYWQCVAGDLHLGAGDHVYVGNEILKILTVIHVHDGDALHERCPIRELAPHVCLDFEECDYTARKVVCGRCDGYYWISWGDMGANMLVVLVACSNACKQDIFKYCLVQIETKREEGVLVRSYYMCPTWRCHVLLPEIWSRDSY